MRHSSVVVLAIAGLSCWLVLVSGASAVTVAADVASTGRAVTSPRDTTRNQGWWVNAKDGWVVDPSGQWRCTPKSLRSSARLSTICATSDGGKHWRLALRVPASENTSGVIRAVFRWDSKNAVVSLWDAAVDTSQTSEFWTRDGGRHWWLTDVFHLGLSSVCYGPDVSGVPHCADPIGFFGLAGHLFFVVYRNDGDTTTDYMLDGWPRNSPMPPCPQRPRGSGPFVCLETLHAGFVAVPA